jgi:hypothetical protein
LMIHDKEWELQIGHRNDDRFSAYSLPETGPAENAVSSGRLA